MSRLLGCGGGLARILHRCWRHLGWNRATLQKALLRFNAFYHEPVAITVLVTVSSARALELANDGHTERALPDLSQSLTHALWTRAFLGVKLNPHPTFQFKAVQAVELLPFVSDAINRRNPDQFPAVDIGVPDEIAVCDGRDIFAGGPDNVRGR